MSIWSKIKSTLKRIGSAIQYGTSVKKTDVEKYHPYSPTYEGSSSTTPSTGTISATTTTSKTSGGGSGGGVQAQDLITPTQDLTTPTQDLTTPTQIEIKEAVRSGGLTTQQKAEAIKEDLDWSGKVESFSPTGKEETKYYVKGKKVGRIFETPEGTFAETEKPSKLKFKKGKKGEEIEFTGEGATIETYQLPKALQTEIATEPPQALKEVKDTLDYGFSRVSGSVTGVDILDDSTQHIRDTSGSWISRVLGYFKEDPYAKKETYSPELGGFVSASPTGETATFLRTPTPEEQEKIEEAHSKGEFIGRSLLEFPVQYTGGYLGESWTPEEVEKISGVKVFDPTKQFEVFKSRKEYEKAIDKFIEINKKLEQANTDYEAGKIDYDQLTAKFDYHQSQPEYQKVLSEYEVRKTLFQEISESDLSPTGKVGSSFAVGVGQVIPYISPPLRILHGVGSIASGLEAFPKAETQKEKLGALAEIGIGAILTRSGFKGGVLGAEAKGGKSIAEILANLEKKAGISGGIGEKMLTLETTKLYRAGKSLGIPALFGTKETLDVYAQTEDLAVSLGAGAGVFAGIKIPTTYQKLRRGTTLTKLEKQKLESDLSKLQDAKISDLTIIRKGRGSLPKSDRVDIIAQQKSGNFVRTIKISGNLVKGEKGLTFFPDGQGKATTLGSVKIKNVPEKGLVDVQTFKVQQIGRGIPLKQIGEYKIGTTETISAYIPKQQVSKLFKVPKGKYFVLKIREVKEIIKSKISKTDIQDLKETGTKVLDYEKGKTSWIQKKVSETEPSFSKKKPQIFEITDTSQALGKIAGKEPIESFGVTSSDKRLGAFFKVSEPVIKDVIIKKVKGIKKTPLSKTFAETEPLQKQTKTQKTELNKEIIKTEPIKLKKEIIKTEPFETKIETIQKGLRKGTKKVIEGLDTKPIEISKSVWGAASRIKVSEKEAEKLGQVSKTRLKTKQDEAQLSRELQLQESGLRTGQTERQATTLLTQQVQELIQTEMVSPIPPTITIRTPDTFLEPPLFPIFKKKRMKEKLISDKQGWDVYIKEPKKKKFVKVTKKPVSFREAQDTKAYFIDESVTRTGYIKPTQKKVSPLMFDIPKGYYGQTEHKFRRFKQKKGKRQPLRHKVIEKGRYLIDTKGEKRGLSIFKAMAEAERKKKQKSKFKKNLPVGLQFA